MELLLIQSVPLGKLYLPGFVKQIRAPYIFFNFLQKVMYLRFIQCEKMQLKRSAKPKRTTQSFRFYG